MKKIIANILPILLMTSLFYSCGDDFYTIKPKGQASLETFYSKEGVNALLTGVYAVIDGGNVRSGNIWASSVTNWVWGSVASDDAYKGSSYSDQGTINPIEGFFADADNSYVANHWRAYYDGVVRSNDVLKVLPKIEGMLDEEKNSMAAQARFLRAHFYFELTKVHYKVPWIDENTENPTVVSNDRVLWAEIEADLKFAVENLPESWSGEPGRATAWAAKTMLAQVYMFQSKFPEAKTLLNDVVTNGGFELMESYEQNYMAATRNNKESILEIQYAVNDGSDGSYNAGWGDALNFPQGGKIGTCCGFFQPTQNFVNAFKTDESGLPLLDTFNDESIPWANVWKEENPDVYTKDFYPGNVDPRLDHTVGRPGVPYLDWGPIDSEQPVRDLQNSGPYLFKKNMFLKADKGSGSTTTGWATGVNNNSYRKYRLAHAMLWLAECAAETDDLPLALSMVNQIRERAKNSNYVKFDGGEEAANYAVESYASFADKEFALKAIRHEMRLEFGMEGYRFFDLVRWGIASDVMNDYLETEGEIRTYLSGKQFVADKHEYWPVPQTQIDLSVDESGASVLEQTPGY